MKKNLIDNSKAYIHYYYNNGVWVKDPDFRFDGKLIDPEAIEFGGEFFHFLIESTFLNEYTIMWLNSNVGSIREMVEVYNNSVQAPDRIPVHKIETNIDYDKRKLKKYFSINMLNEVFAYPEKHLDNCRNILDSLQRKYMKDKEYMKPLVINISKEYLNKTIDDRSWALLLNLLQTYNRRTIESINNGTNPIYTPEMFGYFNYLISSKKLNSLEKERLSNIQQILGVQSYENK